MKDDKCRWTYDEEDDAWDGTCGIKWQLTNDGTPRENGMNYCPSCGKELLVNDEQLD